MDFWSKNSIPIGTIVLWSGAVVDIPAGWAKCDGTNGTPDLSAKFVICSALGYAVGQSGGSDEHNHLASGYVLRESLGDGTDILDSSPSGNYDSSLEEDTVIVSVSNNTTLPPYYALAYIMKL